MGNQQAKPIDQLKFIDREVNSMRSSIRSARRTVPEQTKEEYIQRLTRFSSQAGDLRGKVKDKHLEQTQKSISNAMNEVLTKVSVPPESDLDLGAVETNSIIQLPLNKRQASSKGTSERPSKKQKNVHADPGKPNTTLLDIEAKLNTLKPQINVAIVNKDTTMLRVHQETIRVLATDLEMIDIYEDTPIGDKKKKLEANVASYYQKIGKAMKEIKRNKDINYLAKQTKRDKALKELEEIKRALQEATSPLDASLKNNDSSALKNIQEKLVEINQRLSSIEASDEATKSMKMQLMDQFKSFYTRANATNTGSQSDLSKAQSNYEDIVRNIASGQNKDKDDIKIKLESLQSFIKNIKGDDANTLKQKEQLLNNVRRSFSSILDSDKKEETNTIKRANSVYQELDGLYNNWKTIQKQIRLTTYSSEVVAKIDKILEDIQNSIGLTRQQITGITSRKSNLDTKLNFSTPNLSSSKPLSKLEGSATLDHPRQASPIRTRAKVYDLAIPEIKNVSDQPVVLRNKKFYKNFELKDDYHFTKIEEIKTQVNYIKEKFPESQQKQHLKNKLESYVEILEGYVHHKNQTTAKNARIVVADIKEMLASMSHVQEAMNTTARRSLFAEDSLENIAGIQGAVDKIQTDIDNFSGTKDDEDYTRMRNGLAECRKCLEDTKVPPKYEMIQQQKQQILVKIDNLLEALENKAIMEDSHVMAIEEAVSKLQNEIVMFSGKRGDKEYTKIKNGLLECRNCLEDTIIPPKYEMLQRQKDALLKKIPHLFVTLDSKSGNYQEDPVVVITRRNLNGLKEKVRRFSGAYKGVLFNNIEKALNKLLLDVSETIEDKDALDEIVKDIEKYLKILEHRSTKDQSFRRTMSDGSARHEDEDKLVKLKTDLMNIKLAIDTTPTNGVNLFVGLKSRLDLVKLGLDQLKLMSEDDQKQKDIMYNEVETYKNLVEAKIGLGKQAIRQWPVEQDKNKRQEDELNKIEEKFKTLKPEIENFVGTTADNKFYELDETSIRLVLRMDKMQFTKGTDIYNRKINLLKDIYNYGDILDQRAKETEDMIEIEREVQDLEINFKDNLKRDPKALRDKVNKLQEKINSTELNKNLLRRKDNSLVKIKAMLDALKECEKRSSEKIAIIEKRNAREEINKIEEKFNTFKPEIENFVGTISDDKFHELDGNSMSLVLRLDNLQFTKGTDLYNKRNDLLKQIYHYGDVLARKAKETANILEIENEIDDLENNFQGYLTNYPKALEEKANKLQQKLNSTELNKNLLERKENSLAKTKAMLDALKGTGKRSSEETVTIDSKENESAREEINKVEEKFKNYKPEIENFVGTTSDDKYYELDENSIRLILRLDNLQFTKGTDLYNKKNGLLKEIYHYGDVLAQKAKETESMLEIESEIQDLEKNFQVYLRTQPETLGEKVKKLQEKINSTELNRNLLERKATSITKTKALLAALNQTEVSSNKEIKIERGNTSTDPENEISEIEIQSGNIKKEIEQFVGIHADRKYYELDGAISALFSKLDSCRVPEGSELHARKTKLLKETQLCRDKLDKKAKETEIVREINKQLISINNKIDNYKNTNEELKVIETELKSVQSKLAKFQISDVQKKALQQKYDILFGEYNRFTKAKALPKNNYIGSTSFLADVQNLSKSRASLNGPDPMQAQISELQTEIDKARSQVEVFANTDASEEYKKIEESLLLLNLRVNKLDIPKDDQLYQRKLNLDKDIKHCLTILDERAQEAEESLVDIERELEAISKKFDGITTDDDRNSMDEKLISLQLKLGKLHVGDDLSQRKNMCMNRIIIYSKHLKEMSNYNPEGSAKVIVHNASSG